MIDPRPPSPLLSVVSPDGADGLHDAAHDRLTRRAQAGRIARMLDLPMGSAAAPAGAYLVPAETLLLDDGVRLGVTETKLGSMAA